MQNRMQKNWRAFIWTYERFSACIRTSATLLTRSGPNAQADTLREVATSPLRCTVTPAALPRTKIRFHLNALAPWSLQYSTTAAIFFFNCHLGRRRQQFCSRLLLQEGKPRPPPLPVRHRLPEAVTCAWSSAAQPLRLALCSQTKAFDGAAAAAARHDPLASAAGSRRRLSRALGSRIL